MMYEYRAYIEKVVDGDTVHALVDLGCDVTVRLTIRLNGINAPENSTVEGKEVTAYLKEQVEGREVILKTFKDKKEKYGRYLGEIFSATTNQSLNKHLVEKGYAVAYDGGAR